MKNKDKYIEEYINYLYGDIEEKDRPMYAPDIFQSRRDFTAGYEKGQPKWISVSEQTPPSNTELLVKAHGGTIHLSNWRESYNIFSCQVKSESSYDWQYMKIPQ